MKDVLHEVTEYQRDPSLLLLLLYFLSSCLALGLISQPLFIQVVEKGGDGERVVYTAQLDTDRTFNNPAVSFACEKRQKLVQVLDPPPHPLPPPPLPIPGPTCG